MAVEFASNGSVINVMNNWFRGVRRNSPDGWLRIPHGSNYLRRRQQPQQQRQRLRRHIDTNTNATDEKVPEVFTIEIAIFVDKDLYRHMLKNFPKNTEANLIRFVLAMVNGVIIQ